VYQTRLRLLLVIFIAELRTVATCVYKGWYRKILTLTRVYDTAR